MYWTGRRPRIDLYVFCSFGNFVIYIWTHERVWLRFLPFLVLHSVRLALVWMRSTLDLDLMCEPGLGLVWSGPGCSSQWVSLLFLLPVLKRRLKTRSRGLASGASCAIKWWSYWRCCARSTLWCQTLFFFTPPTLTPPPPPYLPHLESIKLLLEEGKSLTTGNAFTMSGKARGTPFIRLKHPCRRVLGPVFVLRWKVSRTTQTEFYSLR